MPYPRLRQINTKKCPAAQTGLDVRHADSECSGSSDTAVAPSSSVGASEVATPRQPRVRRGESTPLVGGDLMYMSTACKRGEIAWRLQLVSFNELDKLGG